MHILLTWENLAVILAIAYLLFVLLENSLAWVCAFFSTAIYTLLFWDVSLFMDSALNAYYLLMAVYGWLQWKKRSDQSQSITIHSWSLHKHAIAILLIACATGISGFFLAKNTSAAWPYLDSFTTWASLFATYLVTQKVLENWLYWIVIDSVSVMLYFERGLTSTAYLFIFYIILCVFGWGRWKKQLSGDVSLNAAS